jgi:hypothetical protein
MMHQRGEIEGVTVRLPGILARPRGLRDEVRVHERFVPRVARRGGVCLPGLRRGDDLGAIGEAMRGQSGACPQHGCGPDAGDACCHTACSTHHHGRAGGRRLRGSATSPPIWSAIGPMRAGSGFRCQPAFVHSAAERAGFAHDGNLATLVTNALAVIAQGVRGSRTMRFQRLDLNLLVALDALLTERSVSLAAERICPLPICTSSALGGCATILVMSCWW